MRPHAAGALIAALACAPGDGGRVAGDSANGTSGSVTPPTLSGQTSTAAPRAREIYIDSVTGSNPITVFGRARTFENTVQVRVRDATGALIAERFTTSAGEMGTHNLFSVAAWLTRPPGDAVIVEAFEYSANDGSVRSLTGDTIPYRADNAPLTLVFPTSDCTQTARFTRQAPKAVAPARLLVEALVAGPNGAEQAAGATSPFPAGSAVNSVVLRGGVLTVDFNHRLQNVGGSCAAQGIRAAVTETLMRLPAVRSVVITADGSRELALQP